MARLCLIGLDEPESAEILKRTGQRILVHSVLPKILVRDGQLFVEAVSGMGFVPVSRVVYHGIFENDHDFLAGLALWNGPCFPNAHAMMDCRLKLPCLARALRYTRFGNPPRGFASAGATFETEVESVAKWGNWHCGENKARFQDRRQAEEASIVEPFLPGKAMRVVIIDDAAWQIRLEGSTWLKSIHDDNAAIVPLDPELLADTQGVANGFGLDLIANDYIITDDGTPHFLEVNHIPNVTRFEEIRSAYIETVCRWLINS